jgi:hypothetical protein
LPTPPLRDATIIIFPIPSPLSILYIISYIAKKINNYDITFLQFYLKNLQISVTL